MIGICLLNLCNSFLEPLSFGHLREQKGKKQGAEIVIDRIGQADPLKSRFLHRVFIAVGEGVGPTCTYHFREVQHRIDWVVLLWRRVVHFVGVVVLELDVCVDNAENNVVHNALISGWILILQLQAHIKLIREFEISGISKVLNRSKVVRVELLLNQWRRIPARACSVLVCRHVDQFFWHFRTWSQLIHKLSILLHHEGLICRI